MRIAIFTETAPPSVNGVVRRLDHTLRHLADGGDEVLVFAPSAGSDRWQSSRVVGAPSFPLPMYPELAVAVPRPALRSQLARFKPDVVHLVNPAVLGVGGAIYARSLGLPVIASFHTHLPRYLHHYGLGVLEPLAWDLIRGVHNQASLNLCISETVAAELRERGLERVSVGWRGGVDTDLFHPKRADAQMRARLAGGAPEAPLMIAVGRLGAEKGLEVMSSVLACLPGARLAVVGDGPHRRALEHHFAGLPVVFTGFLAGEELASAVASADVMVFPSQTDTLGLVLLEAMAAGTPVVAAAGGGVPDVVEDGVSGLLFAPGDGAAAAAAVRRLLDDPLRRELVRLGGRRQAEAWSWPAAVADLRGWYQRAIEAEAPAAAA